MVAKAASPHGSTEGKQGPQGSFSDGAELSGVPERVRLASRSHGAGFRGSQHYGTILPIWVEESFSQPP